MPLSHFQPRGAQRDPFDVQAGRRHEVDPTRLIDDQAETIVEVVVGIRDQVVYLVRRIDPNPRLHRHARRPARSRPVEVDVVIETVVEHGVIHLAALLRCHRRAAQPRQKTKGEAQQ